MSATKTPLHLLLCLCACHESVFSHGVSIDNPARCVDCAGTGYRFPGLGRDCPGIKFHPTTTITRADGSRHDIIHCDCCNGTGRIANYTTDALMEVARQAGYVYMNFEPEVDPFGFRRPGGLIACFIRPKITGIPWKGLGITPAEALQSALEAAVCQRH